MLLVRSTPDAHKTPLYQMKIKIEGRSAAWKSQTMIVMLKDDLNTLICLFTEDWMKLYQFGIKPRGTFTRFNVERTYQTLTKWCENFSMKTLFSKQEKSIKICCFKCFKVNWKKKRRIAMLCWKNYQVNRSFILLLRWMETFATLNPAWWKKNWICCFDMKENDQNNTDSLIHKIRVNFRWLNISGNKQLNKRKSRKFLTLTWSQFSSWGSEKPGMSQCSKFKINLTKTLELLIKQLSERRTLLTYAHYPTRWWWWWW